MSNRSHNRRGVYRLDPDAASKPSVTITHSQGQTRPEGIRDISACGVRVEYSPRSAPVLRPGSDVTVSIEAQGLEGVADLDARTVFSATRNERTIVALMFTTLPANIAAADSKFFAVFNRRAARRQGDGNEPVNVRLHTQPGDANTPTRTLSVMNFSTTGIGFEVDPALDAALQTLDRFELIIQTDRGERKTIAEIRHRSLRGDVAYYGCRLHERD